MSWGTSKQSSLTLSFCMTAPFRRVVNVNLRGSLISSAVTSHGPNEPLALYTEWHGAIARTALTLLELMLLSGLDLVTAFSAVIGAQLVRVRSVRARTSAWS